MPLRSLPVIWLLSLAPCFAQTSATTPPPEPNGTVTGRIFCADTGLPCRFATVSLMTIPKAEAKTATPSTKPERAEVTRSTAVQSSFDGSYILRHVAPGDFYVIVLKEGYVAPLRMFSKRQLDHPDDQLRSILDHALPRVHVEQDATTRADVQLQRGAAISGTITFDDGSPAGGIGVTVLHKDETGKWVEVPRIGVRSLDVVTNDRGVYRLSSLPPDSYLLRARLSLADEIGITDGNGGGSFTNVTRAMLYFYGDGTAHIDEADSFALRGSDERPGQNMTLPLNKLHRLTGRVVAGANGHTVNSGKVELFYVAKGSAAKDTGSKDEQSIASTEIGSDEAEVFHFEFIPEGDYTLRVTRARDSTWEPRTPAPSSPFVAAVPHVNEKERVLDDYGDVDIPLTVRGDMIDIVATIPPKKK